MATNNNTVNRDTKGMDIYRIEVAYAISKNWKIEDVSGLDKTLVTALAIKVMPNGEIKDIIYIKKSGNKLLDDSAYQAIEKTNPTKPFPESIIAPYIELGLRFGPKGVK
jgi:colicin import membrane protein